MNKKKYLNISVFMAFLSIYAPGVAQESSPIVEIQFNDTIDLDDDFLCWTPRLASIRVLNGSAISQDNVLITMNDKPIRGSSTGELYFQPFTGVPVGRENFDPKNENTNFCPCRWYMAQILG